MYEAKSISYYTGSIATGAKPCRREALWLFKSPVRKEEKKNHG
jgi:hypothetical protein